MKHLGKNRYPHKNRKTEQEPMFPQEPIIATT